MLHAQHVTRPPSCMDSFVYGCGKEMTKGVRGVRTEVEGSVIVCVALSSTTFQLTVSSPVVCYLRLRSTYIVHNKWDSRIIGENFNISLFLEMGTAWKQ